MAKKLLTLGLLLVFGVFMATSVYALQAPSSQGGNPDNWYMEVQWNQGATAGAVAYRAPSHGEVVEWDVDSDTGETLGYTVHVADSTDSELAAGIVPSWDDSSHNMRTLPKDGDTFLIQIRGYNSGICSDSSVTEGQRLENTANGLVTDGDGVGIAFKADATNDSTNAECGYGGSYTKGWVNVLGKGTN